MPGTPGITAAVGGRPKPSPCLKLFSFLHPKAELDATVTVDGKAEVYKAAAFEPQTPAAVSVSQPGGYT